ncbi:L-aspartate oxidase [Oscillatoria laete-virens NRMC-F 0139]|nr:L-aspartate oxidase [Oscillatoria laete-virens]MDL5055081.1 L-aspartate oxidase [Oscillatoria laete-virens NRMC-F 0139]
MQKNYDYLVLGSGIAGLTFALQAARNGSVAIVTKKNKAESNTNYAQGGIAVVASGEDSFEAHVQDTLTAGAGLCKEQIVRTIIEEGPKCVQELIDLGMKFSQRIVKEARAETRLRGVKYDLGREGGHSKRRILHSGDVTGREIESALLDAVARNERIQIYENHYAIDLITTQKLGYVEENSCLGAYVYDQNANRILTFCAKRTVLSTGGCGRVYLYTTNPQIATGDGLAMARRAGAMIANMEFIQFHPTCLFHPQEKSFLISEAVRGEGGVLVDGYGQEFMHKYHPLKSLAPRDIVARAIDAEMKITGAPCMYLDITNKPRAFLKKRFPNIYATCLRLGIDMAKEPIPVVPAAHYCCGGVATDVDGRTNIRNLLAVGEVACTGLHGANRLASNSLLEALVVAHRAADHCADHYVAHPRKKYLIPAWQSGDAHDADEMVIIHHNWDEIRRLMWDYVGIVRTTKRLQRAKARIINLEREIQEFYWDFKVNTDLLELRNIVTVASLIIDCALLRKESRGLHYTMDYPDKCDTHSLRDSILN